jgi:redox-sensitive bicupin YhaK (pirin superfamily)
MTRDVESVHSAVARREGDGLEVGRVMPGDRLPHANPFLLVEEIGPVDLAAAVQTVQRPARGFEEVTWVLAGAVNHVRRQGANNVTTAIAANRAEWLTTGRGDVYLEEFPAGAGVRTLRIWIALPRLERHADRQIVVDAPGTDRLPMWTPAGASAGTLEIDVLAGSLLGARPRIRPRPRVTVARLRIPADTTFVHAVESVEPGLEAPTVLLYGLADRRWSGRCRRPTRCLSGEYRRGSSLC